MVSMMKKIYNRSSPANNKKNVATGSNKSNAPAISKKPSKKLDVSLIPRHISRQDWKALRYMFNTCRNDIVAYLESTEGNDDTSSPPFETMMHLCARHHPPLDVLFAFFECSPKAIRRADQWGRYPLHTACRCGASFDVIAFLIKQSSAFLTDQDRTGKTPLHLTCEYFMRTYDPLLGDANGIRPEDAILEIVKRMYTTAPEIVNIEDDQGETAIEIAIEFGAPLKVVKKLQKASERDWKARRYAEGSSHEDMRKEFQKEISSKRQLQETQDRSTSDLMSQAPLTLSGDQKGSEQQPRTSPEKEHPLPSPAPSKKLGGSARNPFSSLSLKSRERKQNNIRANAA